MCRRDEVKKGPPSRTERQLWLLDGDGKQVVQLLLLGLLRSLLVLWQRDGGWVRGGAKVSDG